MTIGSMVVMKGVRRNNLYYFKGSTVTGQVETSISSDDICTQVWQMKVRYGGEKSLQTPVKKGSLEGASTCNLKLGEHNVLNKKKVKFSTPTHHSESLLDCVHVCIWEPANTASLESHRYFVSFIENLSRHCWIYPMRQRCETLDILVKWKDMMEKQTGRKIKEVQICNVERYKNQFLRFGQNTSIDTHFTDEIHGLAKGDQSFLAGEGSVFAI